MMTRAAAMVLSLAMLLPLSAHGRDASGQLQDILEPHSGMPAVLEAGASMEIVLATSGDMVLENSDRRYPLEADWRNLPGERLGATVALPEDIAPGRYGLAYADNRDRNRAAVFVVAEMPEVYAVAHLAGPQISGSENADNRVAEATLKKAFSANVALTLISGPLTRDGLPEDYAALVAWIESQPTPIFVAPGSLERRNAHWRRYFGAPVNGFRFGPDGFMALGLLDAFGAGELDADMGAIQRLRRELKPQRWVLGFTGGNVFQWGMRSQLILLADDPIDGLLVGAAQSAQDEPESPRLPWRETPLFPTPNTSAGGYQIIDMTHAAILPREAATPPQEAPETEDAPAETP